MTVRPRLLVLVACLAGLSADPARADRGFGLGNWGGSSVAVGRNTFYANGLVAGHGRRNTSFSNLAVGVPVAPPSPGRPGLTVYGGGYPYPLGPGPNPFGPPAPRAMPAPSAAQATPWATTPWSRTPWSR